MSPVGMRSDSLCSAVFIWATPRYWDTAIFSHQITFVMRQIKPDLVSGNCIVGIILKQIRNSKMMI